MGVGLLRGEKRFWKVVVPHIAPVPGTSKGPFCCVNFMWLFLRNRSSDGTPQCPPPGLWSEGGGLCPATERAATQLGSEGSGFQVAHGRGLQGEREASKPQGQRATWRPGLCPTPPPPSTSSLSGMMGFSDQSPAGLARVATVGLGVPMWPRGEKRHQAPGLQSQVHVASQLAPGPVPLITGVLTAGTARCPGLLQGAPPPFEVTEPVPWSWEPGDRLHVIINHSVTRPQGALRVGPPERPRSSLHTAARATSEPAWPVPGENRRVCGMQGLPALHGGTGRLRAGDPRVLDHTAPPGQEPLL